jgi:hypothetical protein
MNYSVAFSPEIQLNAQDFVVAWNSTPRCRSLAEARLIPEMQRGFPLDPQLVQQGLVLLAGAAAGIALDVLKDAVKAMLTEYLKQRMLKEPPVTVETVGRTDSACIFVVRQGDK